MPDPAVPGSHLCHRIPLDFEADLGVGMNTIFLAETDWGDTLCFIAFLVLMGFIMWLDSKKKSDDE